MGPAELMNSLSLNSSSDLTTLSVPKLHDDRSNWSGYQSRIEKVMGSKGLWIVMCWLGLGLQAPVQAWLLGAQALKNARPGLKPKIRLGLAWLWPKPGPGTYSGSKNRFNVYMFLKDSIVTA